MPRNTASQPQKRQKKPPACDTCKRRRVLCEPKTDGSPCPRCEGKGIECTTTPIRRGRPRKKAAAEGQDEPPKASSLIDGSLDSAQGQQHTPVFSALSLYTGFSSGVASFDPFSLSNFNKPCSTLSRTWDDECVPPDLPPEVVFHLLECFPLLPQYANPIFRFEALRLALRAAAGDIDLLLPSPRVLAYCIMALSASIAVHPAVIGPIDFSLTADLRVFGMRRAPLFNALHAHAFRLACATGVILEPSYDNAASCFVLSLLDKGGAGSRPWASAYMSHCRALAVEWQEDGLDAALQTLWCGKMMVEALFAIDLRQPVLVSHHDQLLICGPEPPALEQLVESLEPWNSETVSPQLIFSMMQPFFFHITRVAREMSETVTGDFARRKPLRTRCVLNVLSQLRLLQSIRHRLFPAIVPPAPDDFVSPTAPTGLPLPGQPSHTATLATCMQATGAWTNLALGLHRALSARTAMWNAPWSGLGQPPALSAPPSNEQLLALDARLLAWAALREVATTIHNLPNLQLLTHLQFTSVPLWAQFCVDEAERGGVSEGSAWIFATMSSALKSIGYAWDMTLSGELIASLDAYAEAGDTVALAFNTLHRML